MCSQQKSSRCWVEWESSNETATHWQNHLLLLITRRPLSTSLHPTATHRSNGRGRWVCPQLMQTSVVIAVGSPSHPPLLRLSLVLLLWRQLIWVRHEAPLRFLSRAEKPPDSSTSRRKKWKSVPVSDVWDTDRAAWILNSIQNVVRTRRENPQLLWGVIWEVYTLTI